MEDFVSTKEEEDSEVIVGGIVLDSTAEFCRTLGDIPTYGQAGNRDVDAEELMVCIIYTQLFSFICLFY